MQWCDGEWRQRAPIVRDAIIYRFEIDVLANCFYQN